MECEPGIALNRFGGR